MMPAESCTVFFFLARMGTRKKVHAFVRVKPTDDFAHDMIKYGDDNKVSGTSLLHRPGPLCPPSLQRDPVSKQPLRTQTELLKVQMDSRVQQVQTTPLESLLMRKLLKLPF